MAESSQSYRLTVKRSAFYAVVNEYLDPVENKRHWVVLVGGQTRGCVEITIPLQSTSDLEGVLNVTYDRRCNVNGDLHRGTGTVTMLRAAITFTFNMFPNVKHIVLKDDSKVMCEGFKLHLPPLQLALHGKTWYERMLQARVDKERDRKPLEKYVRACQRSKGPFEPFWKAHIEGHLPNDDTRSHSRFKERIAAYWANHDTLQAMVTSMKANNDCILFVHWLSFYCSKVMQGHLIVGMNFLVERDVFQKLEMETVQVSDPYQRLLRSRAAESKRKHDILDTLFMRGGMHGSCFRGTRYTFGKGATLNDVV